jgi:glutamine synthetase
MGELSTADVPTKDNISMLLADDLKVKVAGIDCDGILRGKVMCKSKFLASVDQGFGMSSAVFGWDVHDELYRTETKIASAEQGYGQGYGDFMAIPDVTSFRRLPWEDDIPLFLVQWQKNGAPVSADGRSLLRSLCAKIGEAGLASLAGGMNTGEERRNTQTRLKLWWFIEDVGEGADSSSAF